MNRLALALAIALVGTAHAAHAAPKPRPTPKATVSPAAHKQYGELMQLGRNFQKHKDWPKAIGAFEKAIETIPDDVTALTELGWTAYLAKDLDKAEAATRRAVASDGAPNIRGAALYNLGLIFEARHDPKAAMAAYTESIKVRPHSVVRAALAKLDKAAAAALDPYAAKPLDAIRSPAAFCAALPATDEDGKACTCTAKQLAKAVDSIDRACHDPNGGSAGYQEHWLAVMRNGAWFASDLVSRGYENMRCSFQVELGVEPQGKRLLARVVSDGFCGNGVDDHDWGETALVVLGTRGGVPAATPAFVIARRESTSHDDKDDVSAAIELAPTWNADGSLTLAGTTKGLDKAEAANTLGRHDLGLD